MKQYGGLRSPHVLFFKNAVNEFIFENNQKMRVQAKTELVLQCSHNFLEFLNR